MPWVAARTRERRQGWGKYEPGNQLEITHYSQLQVCEQKRSVCNCKTHRLKILYTFSAAETVDYLYLFVYLGTVNL